MAEARKIVWFLFAGMVAAGVFFRPWKAGAEGAYPDLTPAQARELIQKQAGNPDFVILDVRTPGEFQSERIDGAVLLDFHSGNFRAEAGKLPRGKTYLVYCRTGNRSRGALKVLGEEGFRSFYHLDGGIVKWKEAGLPTKK
jgi:rhodanese-related sulfurtransferase